MSVCVFWRPSRRVAAAGARGSLARRTKSRAALPNEPWAGRPKAAVLNQRRKECDARIVRTNLPALWYPTPVGDFNGLEGGKAGNVAGTARTAPVDRIGGSWSEEQTKGKLDVARWTSSHNLAEAPIHLPARRIEPRIVINGQVLRVIERVVELAAKFQIP